ncbi:hypothetical protein ONZ43_g4285 [Nemania bipapillata]|uniref:Uncharacterized protein n=1 Tax=Nemania bipapillata TaxID=110536 RepID=A0ACC2IPP1_9PEZI|nr:hypothetical protein ONZ43_g4285 [Nemania bipapillata]
MLKGIPTFKVPTLRRGLLQQLKSWCKHATSNFDEASIYSDGDGDPFWGSSWTRFRHKNFSAVFNDDAMASHDLAIAWGSTAQVVPCAMMASFHVLNDPSLLRRVRDEIITTYGNTCPMHLDAKQLSSSALLSSIYAETLRLHTTAFIPVVPMHGDLPLGKWLIPKDSFWADRFIIDPADPQSGPINPKTSTVAVPSSHDTDKPYFTLKGLEGAWVPYGGGQHMCPGRFLAKSIITSSIVLICSYYDVEFRTDSLPLGTSRFGFGPEHPFREIPFRIKRRAPEQKEVPPKTTAT